MQLRRANFEIYSVLLVISLGILGHSVSEAQINLTTSGLRVTDVNTTAFSLVWVVNKAATSFANVYADPNGNQPIAGLTIKDESFDHPPAGQNGVMKVRISGLAADTIYYYQIVTISTGAILVEPASGVLPSVRTELITIPVSNDSLAHRVLQSDGSTPALGALLLAEVAGGNYPVTGWVADGISAPWALVNLNNIFSAATHENLELFGGEAITLVSIGGFMGFQNISAQVPVETGGFQTLVPAPSDEQCTLDVDGPIIEADQIEPVPNSFINNGIPLIKGAYHVANLYSEIDTDSVRLLVDGEDVTANATVDSSSIVYTPTVPLSEGSHDVTLFVADDWGNEAGPFSWSFGVDLSPPTATVAYSAANSSHVDAGTFTITATFSEPLMTSPQIVIDRPDPMSTIGPDNMTGSGTVWTYDVTIETHNGTTVFDGVNIVVISNATDLAGNTAAENFTSIFTTDTKDTDGDGERDYLDSDDDNDSLPDAWEVTYGLNPLVDDAGDDPDGDGSSNLDEYNGGRHPRNCEPDSPVLLSPLHAESSLPLTPTLNTSPFSDYSGCAYPDDAHSETEWQISSSADFSDNTAYVLSLKSSISPMSLTVPDFILSTNTTYYWRAKFHDAGGAASAWSDPFLFTTVAADNSDPDGDGIPDDQEISDTTLDLDDNGTPDINQADIKCVNTVVGAGQIGIRGTTSNVLSIDGLKSIDPSAIPSAQSNGEVLPLGLTSFQVTVVNAGDAAEVTLYFSETLPIEAKFYKYDQIHGLREYPYASFGTTASGNTYVTLQLQDGNPQYGDADGLANSIIVDPGGVGITSVSSAPSQPSSSGGGGGGGGCFIATATIGTEEDTDFTDRHK